MKKILKCLVVLIVLLVSKGFSQSVNENVNLKKLLYIHFIKAEVFLKNGNIVTVPLNYNTDNQNFVFIEDGLYKEVTGFETIDSVIIEHIKFIPVKSRFYECTSTNNLYVSYSNVPVPKEAVTDRTGSHKENTSEVSNTVSNVYTYRNFRNDSDVKYIKHFWLKDGDSFTELKNARQISKAFSIDQQLVKDYFEMNNPDLNFEPDVLKLMQFINKQIHPTKKGKS